MIEFVITLLFTIFANNTTTFYYEVTSGASPAISHVTYELCDAATVIKAGINNRAAPYEFGYDSATQLYGIKFDQPFADDETKTLYFTLAGEWATLETTVGVKAGEQISYTQVSGPACSPTAVNFVEGSVGQPLIEKVLIAVILFFLGLVTWAVWSRNE